MSREAHITRSNKRWNLQKQLETRRKLDSSKISIENARIVRNERHDIDVASRRGTVFSRRWEGTQAPVVDANQVVTLTVQRQPDQGSPIDETIPFAVAITLTMPGIMQIYDEVRARLAIVPRVGVR